MWALLLLLGFKNWTRQLRVEMDEILSAKIQCMNALSETLLACSLQRCCLAMAEYPQLPFESHFAQLMWVVKFCWFLWEQDWALSLVLVGDVVCWVLRIVSKREHHFSQLHSEWEFCLFWSMLYLKQVVI